MGVPVTASDDRLRRVRLVLATLVGIGGVATLALAAGLAWLPEDVPPAQRVGAALVPTIVGIVAVWRARALWRGSQRNRT